MKKKGLLIFLVIFSGLLWGQGLETFDNLGITGNTYQSGIFSGQDGSDWTFTECRGDYEITGKAIMIGKGRTPQSNFYSGTISGGIGTLSFDYMQAFSTNVNLNILVNDVVVGNVTSSGEQGIVKQSGTITVEVDGDIVIKFIGVFTSSGQAVVDNVSWTAYQQGSNYPPEITNIVQTPATNIDSATTVSVTANVSDSDGTISSVELRYGTSSGVYLDTILMSWVSGSTYITSSTIPAHVGGTTVFYSIYAEDNENASTQSSEQSYSVISGYYDAVEGFTGTTLWQGLQTIISNGHTPLSDNGARAASYTNLDNYDGYVQCVYSGVWEVPGSSYPYTPANFSIEHSYPQSWYNSSGDNIPEISAADTDLHHLFPAHQSPNSSRGNKPFDYITSVYSDWGSGDYYSYNGTNAYDVNAFEVSDDYKGNVARALFYMTIRYYDNSAGLTRFGVEMLPLLYQWHEQDPIDTNEIVRNDAAYAEQGNRNPFVDHPEFVEAIWGDLLLATPTNLSATTILSNSFTANWQAGRAIQYRLDVSTDQNFLDYNGFIAGYKNLQVSGTSYTVTGLAENTTYYYRVKAVETTNGNLSMNSIAASALTLDSSQSDPSVTIELRPSHIDLASADSESAVLLTIANYPSNDARYRLYNGSSQYYCWDEFTESYVTSTSYADGPQIPGSPSQSSTFWMVFQRGSNNSTEASYRDRLAPGYSSNYQTKDLPVATSISMPYTLSGTFIGAGSYDTMTKHIVTSYSGTSLISASSTSLISGDFSVVCPDGISIDKIEIRAVDNTLIADIAGNWSSTTDIGNIPAAGNQVPQISNIIQTPVSNITSTTTVSVSADVTDSDGMVDVVELHWGTISGTYPNIISMTSASGDTYVTNHNIPAQANGTTVCYVVYAGDDDGGNVYSNELYYEVSDGVSTPKVIFTEICDHSTYQWEYIEIYNAGSSSVNLDGWIVEERYHPHNDGERAMTLSSSNQINTGGSDYMNLNPGEFALFLRTASELNNFKTAYSIGNNLAIFSGNVPQMNGDERYQLRDGNSKVVIDSFGEWEYVDSSSFRVIGGNSYQRINGTASDGVNELNWDSEYSDSYLSTPGWDNETPLPVTLSSFTAHFQYGTAYLKWTTQSELNNSHWNVYRSPSQNIGQARKINPSGIAGAGTTYQPTDYQFEDTEELSENDSYWYWIESSDYAGTTELHGPIHISIPVSDNADAPPLPEVFGLYGNYPNPFNPSTSIQFRLEEGQQVELSIFDVKGRKVRMLYRGVAESDKIHSFLWDGKNENGEDVASGIYLYRLESAERTELKKMSLIK